MTNNTCLWDDANNSPFDRSKPKVKAAIHPTIDRFLNNKELVFSLIDGVGSPLNIIFPDNICETIARFEKVYSDRNLQGQIFYTSKPNKSLALRKRAALTKVGLDVSSEGELKNALSSGFSPQRIEATGPKNLDYLTLSALQGILINVDNFAELKQLVSIHKLLPSNERIRILVRLDGFTSDRVKFTEQESAFGNNVETAQDILNFLVQHKNIFDFYGFSFHFNAGDYIRRGPAIEKCLELTFAAMEMGLSPRGIDIGGGYRIRYAESQDDWNAYIEELKSSVLGKRSSLTWNDSGLGYSSENGLLKGAPNFMEHYHKDDGHEDLASVIDEKLPAFDNQSLAQILSDSLLELYIEPGRALLDQCGITLAKVNFSKLSMQGQNLAMLDMNRTNINATQLKLMTDPIILYRNNDRTPCDNGVIYAGNLCLTHDMIQYQKTFPDYNPSTDDVVAFINTAAYQMDFAETNVLQQRIAQKIAVTETSSGFKWALDEIYNPMRYMEI
jgi:diaminopimelate decarboxylase